MVGLDVDALEAAPSDVDFVSRSTEMVADGGLDVVLRDEQSLAAAFGRLAFGDPLVAGQGVHPLA